MSYLAKQKQWIKEHNFNKGVEVKITRVAKDHEDGWDNTWGAKGMYGFVGKTGVLCNSREIEKLHSSGIPIYCEELDDWFSFPYFILEVVEDDSITITKDSPHYEEVRKLVKGASHYASHIEGLEEHIGNLKEDLWDCDLYDITIVAINEKIRDFRAKIASLKHDRDCGKDFEARGIE